ncbi:cob(I)yrinic acid a,c-diamide adenosyltransferase [Echinimonas agarilytica]|uniref:Corrinoid adenosyltransferase n=1 Tax=Echinimonas agarilytica TaxID=1215918 RepID=A0AA42B9J2_9GAMM|nr:cob(I)yrinic acid a,c-diamide adenosyltransferase [Echinimonas agarilytica]MCM2681146.1 cob(I)yrinic acid a,c-diamide adenosyltransferase [Echinimonas agarilytica]
MSDKETQTEDATSTKQQKHQERQQKLKQKVDERIAAASEDKGLFLVITGNGKGKSTAGFGVVTRAVGHGYKAGVAQFIKGQWECGERNLLQNNGVEFHVMGTGFTWETQNRESDIEQSELIWKEAKRMLADPSIDVVLLDELTYLVSYKYLELDDVVNAIANRPDGQHVVVTGRGCHRQLIEMADTVSEVQSTKHAFDSGIKAQKGIDW